MMCGPQDGVCVCVREIESRGEIVREYYSTPKEKKKMPEEACLTLHFNKNLKKS